MNTANCIVENMGAGDWEAVIEIYQEGIATGNATVQTEAPPWERWNNHHRPDCRLVAKDGDLVVDWAALSPVSSRDAYSGVAEVSVYVAEKLRGEGVGKLMLNHLVSAS
jgi:phosphinothricin acetyltransferase